MIILRNHSTALQVYAKAFSPYGRVYYRSNQILIAIKRKFEGFKRGTRAYGSTISK